MQESEAVRFYRVWLQVMAGRCDEEKEVFSLYYEAKSVEHLHEILEGGGKCPGRTDASVLGIKPVSRDEYEVEKVLDFKRQYIRASC